MKKASCNAQMRYVLGAECYLSDAYLSPIILREKGESPELLLWISPYPQHKIPKELRAVLSPKALDCVRQLRAVCAFQASAIYNLRAFFRGVLPTYSIYKYFDETEPEPEHRGLILSGVQACECYALWESKEFPEPCLIDGVSMLHNKHVEYVQSFKAPVIDVSQLKLSQEDYEEALRCFISSSLYFNKIVLDLYKLGLVLFDASLEYEHICLSEPVQDEITFLL